LAHAAAGDLDAAIGDHTAAIAAARDRGAAFELAQCILALDACLAVRGTRATGSERAEAYATLKRLGVRDVQLPLPS
jgi:hypothetical protein